MKGWSLRSLFGCCFFYYSYGYFFLACFSHITRCMMEWLLELGDEFEYLLYLLSGVLDDVDFEVGFYWFIIGEFEDK